jgi:hypothetical protein
MTLGSPLVRFAAVETNARASQSRWRASSGNPAGAHENVLLVVVDPPLRKRNAGE